MRTEDMAGRSLSLNPARTYYTSFPGCGSEGSGLRDGNLKVGDRTPEGLNDFRESLYAGTENEGSTPRRSGPFSWWQDMLHRQPPLTPDRVKPWQESCPHTGCLEP